MFKKAVLILLLLSLEYVNAQIKLTHNIGETPIETGMVSCEEDEYWARTFKLSDFGITKNDQFIIRSGQVAISKAYGGARIGFSFYSIDSNFPNYTVSLLGSAGYQFLPQVDEGPEIIDVVFDRPIVIPAGVEDLLVVVGKSVDHYNPNSAEIIIAGTEEDTGISWYKGCNDLYTFTPTVDLNIPNANFFINVTGEIFNTSKYGSNTTLTHNICDNLTETSMFSCSYSKFYWARLFELEDFGILNNEEFVINSGQVGIRGADSGTSIKFNIYEVDNNFPNSFSISNLIGSSQEFILPYIGDHNPQIVDVTFDNPIVIKPNVNKILVEIEHVINWGSGVIFIAGTEEDNDFSWYRGCGADENGYNSSGASCNCYITTELLGRPDAKFYINVTGNVNHISNNFEMNISNICSEFLKEFSINNSEEVASIIWNFGDPASGVENTSTDLSPYHDFSADGTYTITATVTAKNGKVEVLTETIKVKEPPKAYGIDNLIVCEDIFGSGISSSFNTSGIKSKVLGSQTNKIVTFIDGSGNRYDELPNPFTNTIKDRETITVQVARNDELCCLSEITFDLIVNPLPDLSNIKDIFVCDDENDGFATFDLSQIQSNLLANDINALFYFQNGQQISDAQLNAVVNNIKNEEKITIKATNSLTNCQNETTFKIGVSSLPVAYPLDEITGCDDNNDGISEYFDTSTIEATVLNGQTNMVVTYFDELNNQLHSPLPNPYTNTIANKEIIRVRVTNPNSECYSETELVLKTSTKPEINQPLTLYTCNNGDGIGTFNTETIEEELIGNQTGLRIYYTDIDGNQLPSPLPDLLQNNQPWSQTIFVKVENEANPACYSETSFNLEVNELPQINLENEYILCDLEPNLYISTNPTFDSWEWTFEDGSLISNSFEAYLIDAGQYTLLVTQNDNGISCENSFSFNLVRSILPKISDVKIQDLSNNNSIEIIAEGDGDFEYSIDGLNFQDKPVFQNLLGGVFNTYVRDKNGCGIDTKEIVLVDYPKFFTPNNDGSNDYWHIQGIEKFPNAVINIFNRFGKLISQLTYDDKGWDGTYNGEPSFASDYWFTTDLGDGRSFKGHFSLIR